MRIRGRHAVLFLVLTAACSDGGDEEVGTGKDGSVAEDGGLDSGSGEPDAGQDAQGMDGSSSGQDGGAADTGLLDGAQDDAGTMADGAADAAPGADTGSPDAGQPDAGATATFSAVYSLFVERCTGCHRPRDGGPAAGLDLSTKAAAYADLVTNPAAESCTDKQRVTPNQPDQSFLVEKLEPNPSCGLRMPRNQSPLPNDQIAIVRAWISAGALNN